MASHKMTFSLPEDVTAPFLRLVQPSGRSKFVAEALRAKMRERETMFEAACDALEGDPDIELLAREMDALNDDPIQEPWDAAQAR